MLATGCVAAIGGDAKARPNAPRLFCEAYPDVPECLGRSITCAKCHSSTQPVAWNSYGGAILAALAGADLEESFDAAVSAVEALDSDSDGLTNLEEIELGSDPADPLSQWMPMPDPEDGENPRYAIGRYDYEFAFRRMHLLFCGTSPNYDELRAFAEASPEEQSMQIHDELSACLESNFWRDEVLFSLAHPKVLPVAAYGPDTEVMVAGFAISLADYSWDYRLWQYTLTGDRDAREMLTAQYHVDLDDKGALVPLEGIIEKRSPTAFSGGQPVPPERRAGMLTTQWSLVLSVMFSAIPRVTAGHVYREYLGLDLGLTEGIRPVPGEPLDLDHKGVSAPACATCHSTLDPIAYAFAEYEGIDFDHLDKIGHYRPDRPEERLPGWTAASVSPVVLDQPVADLVAMARVMADSPEFSRNLVATFFEFAIGHEPFPDQQEEFVALWTSMKVDGYSANRMLHRLVDTEAFGGL